METGEKDQKDVRDIKDLSREELSAWLGERGIAPYRAGQILKWIYNRGADDFSLMTDLNKEIRGLLSEWFVVERLSVEKIERSGDGSVKYLFGLRDRNHLESVLLPERDHYTICVSSQVGCGQGCGFCMTASGGFIRNLTAGEIIAQIRDIGKYLEDEHGAQGMPLKNIVFMGMGEPLANYKALVKALSIITDGSFGLAFSARRVTVSTAGLVPKIRALGEETRANLAVSLNATDNETRSRLMPINRRYPIEALIEACRSFPLRSNRRITFEYILIQGVNDSEKDAYALAKLLHPVRAKINLIPFNEHRACGFQRPDPATVDRFHQILLSKNYTTFIRQSKGTDIAAACGQLRANTLCPKKEWPERSTSGHS